MSQIIFFPQLRSRYKTIDRIIIKIKATFYKEIVQFMILVAIIGNKSSKYFFLITYIKLLSNFKNLNFHSNGGSKILQNRCRITFIPRDSAWYDDLFSFSNTSMQLSNKTKETVVRTIEPS